MRKLLRNRFVRGFLFLMAFVATGIVLAYSITSYLGRREWAATRKALEARGEKLSILEMVPPPLADELNFFAAPAFMELADYELVDNGGVVTAQLRVPEDKQKLNAVKTALGSPFGKSRRISHELTDLASAAAYYRSEGRVLDESRSPAETVLNALEPAQPVVDEVAHFAELPGARFPTKYEDGIHAPLPHVGPILFTARYLSLRAKAKMELGQGAGALKDLLLIIRLADSLRNEPALISLLVRFAVLGIANQTIWEGIARGAWTEAELAVIEGRLDGCNPLAEVANALRSERGSILYALETAMRKGELGELLAIASVSVDSKEMRDGLGAFVLTNVYPKGWVYGDLAFVSNVFQRWIDGLENRQGPIRPADFEFLDSEIGEWSLPEKLQHVVSAVALPSMTNAITKGAALQSELDEARVALALERYRLAKGELPDTLEALVPQYLRAVPLDVMTGEPLNYRKLASDDFLLWSVGWDSVDDDGRPVDPITKKGDIVWMRLPVSAKSAAR